jgi:Ca2+-binding EF-hand superfamily protein
MQSIFESMDTDGSKALTLQELKNAFKMMNISISENDLRRLFSLFDRDESATIDFTEFVDGIRTPLSPARLALVQLVFSELDAECSELLSFEDIAMRYNANGHPGDPTLTLPFFSL